MNKEKTLLLIEADPKIDVFFNDWLTRGYKARVLFKKKNKLSRAIRRCWLKYDLFFSYMWYGQWYNELSDYDTVIIHMSRLTRWIPFIIRKKYPDIRIICWYWNTIDTESKPIKTTDNKIEYWSFDEDDCIKYRLYRNIQYYCKPLKLNKRKNTSDIYFIGRPKGRTEKIASIRKAAEEKGLICDFNIISDDSIIPYSEVKEKLLETRCVLEINKKDQIGLTLRALESLFYEIKLITDNKAIIEEAFYNKDNVFILGTDCDDDLREFLDKPYNHNVDALKDKYDIDRWFENFDGNE